MRVSERCLARGAVVRLLPAGRFAVQGAHLLIDGTDLTSVAHFCDRTCRAKRGSLAPSAALHAIGLRHKVWAGRRGQLAGTRRMGQFVDNRL